LFVRNIGWDTTEEEFKEHMEQFGMVDYAVLCKAAVKDVTASDEKEAKINKKQDKLLGTHKGTGFVRFQNQADADTLLELS
jgi:RNA recognition motif-containing protein